MPASRASPVPVFPPLLTAETTGLVRGLAFSCLAQLESVLARLTSPPPFSARPPGQARITGTRTAPAHLSAPIFCVREPEESGMVPCPCGFPFCFVHWLCISSERPHSSNQLCRPVIELALDSVFCARERREKATLATRSLYMPCRPLLPAPCSGCPLPRNGCTMPPGSGAAPLDGWATSPPQSAPRWPSAAD